MGSASMMRSSSVLGLEEIAVWILTLMVDGLIFFQVHVQIGEGYLNVNLADPFAVLIFFSGYAEFVFEARVTAMAGFVAQCLSVADKPGFYRGVSSWLSFLWHYGLGLRKAGWLVGFVGVFVLWLHGGEVLQNFWIFQAF